MYIYVELCILYPSHVCSTERGDFTCVKCADLRRDKRNALTRSALRHADAKLKMHLAIVFAARKVLGVYKYLSNRYGGYTLVMVDAADQQKLGCPLIKAGGRAGSRVEKIKQQFIGVIVYGIGYYIYRRLPVSAILLILFDFNFM